jgi:hypothetical protein
VFANILFLAFTLFAFFPRLIVIVYTQFRAYCAKRLVVPVLTLDGRSAFQAQNADLAMFTVLVILMKHNVAVNAAEGRGVVWTQASIARPVMISINTLDSRVAFSAEQLQGSMFAVNQRQFRQPRIALIAKNPYSVVRFALAYRKNGTCRTTRAF